MIYKLADNRVQRTYMGGMHISEFCHNKKEENGFYPEDWTASVVRTMCPTDNCDEGLGYTVDGTAIKDIVTGDMSCLVKLLDSAERLVIQVHPTVSFAKEYFNSDYGKTECWYFLNCDDDACIYIGFKPEVTREKWVEAFNNQDSSAMLGMMHKVSVKEGDCFFISGGLPHAIGAGCFMIETQEPTDLMGVVERITPSGNKIPPERIDGGIGEENMLKMFEYKGRSYDEIIRLCKKSPQKISQGIDKIVGEDDTDRFKIFRINGNADFVPPETNGVVIVTDGHAELNGMKVSKGDRLFFNNNDKLTFETCSDFSAIVSC